MAENVIVKHEKDRNEIHFKGEVISKRSSRALTTMTLRVTSMINGRQYTNYPSFAVFDSEAREKADTIPLRVPVVVTGYVTSQKLTDEQKERAAILGMPEQSFVLEDIHICDPGDEVNEITIVGSVERAYVSSSGRSQIIHFIVASIREGKYLKRMKIDVFPKEGVDYISLMARGTRIKAVCHCATSVRSTDNGTKSVEYIVADEIGRA